MELLLCDSWLTSLVGLDIVWEEITPVVVRHIVDIGLGSLRDTLFFYRANVMGFSVIIPGKNL